MDDLATPQPSQCERVVELYRTVRLFRPQAHLLDWTSPELFSFEKKRELETSGP
jgi:hypothetical protein